MDEFHKSHHEFDVGYNKIIVRWAKKAFLQERPVGLCLDCMKEHPLEPEATDAECPECGLHRLHGCASIVMASSAGEYPEF